MTKRQYGLLLLQLFCILEFVLIDFFLPSYYTGMSSILKYLLIWCAFFFALPESSALPLCLTIVCDYFLLFTQHYDIGVGLFAIVHLLYCYFLLLPKRKKLAACLLGLLPFACFLFLLPLPVIALFYGSAFLLHGYIVIKLQQKALAENYYYQHYLLALGLFAVCDCLTVLNYLWGAPAIANMIWLFYAPSQVLLGVLMSHNTSISWQPVHIPFFHLGGKQDKI